MTAALGTGGTHTTGELEVRSEAELTALLGGEPSPAARRKERDRLDDLDRQWLARSPLCLVATSAPDGSCDVSPKGDPPGSARALDDRTLVLPERPGNRRADGFRNVLANPHVGLLFLVPRRTDTLRVNGRARLVRDAPWFDDLTVQGHRPVLALVVTVEQVFTHCAKAFLRSHLWEPETWDAEGLPSRAVLAQRSRPDESLADIERYYGAAYTEGLYRA